MASCASIGRGSTLLERGYGLANRETKTPFTPSTVVQIGSNTKDFTAVALLQLHERGKLNIHDSLAKFFPNAPADKRNITLWQLVQHTAGFPIGLGGDFEPLTRQAFLDAAMARPLAFTPGAREQYSNTGYAILAAVIEKVSGATYDEFVRDNILKPLGLKETGLLLPAFDPKRLAHGYRDGEDQGTMISKPHASDGPYWNLRGNGGMLSTLADMHTFYTALFETDSCSNRRRAIFASTPTSRSDSPDRISSTSSSTSDSRDDVSRSSSRRTRPTFGCAAVRQPIAQVLGLPSPGRRAADRRRTASQRQGARRGRWRR